MTRIIYAASRVVIAVLILMNFMQIYSAGAQPALKKADIERAEKRREEAAESLKTLADLLVARKEQATVVAKYKSELRKANEDATKKELEAKIKAENGKLAQINAQISGLSTGVAEDEIKYNWKTSSDRSSR